MLYLVHMQVQFPHDFPPERAEELKAKERAYSQELQRGGQWKYLWRVVGEYANYSIFDVGSNDELHDILSKLPLLPYLRMHVTPLAKHPSSIE